MRFNKEQEKEIGTIKERTITLKLSDADCERIAKKAGEHGLTVGMLLENFIGDLIDGTYSNGSDERDRAEQWFERCWFGIQFLSCLGDPQIRRAPTDPAAAQKAG
jgi:hypothetical protein